MRERLPWCAIHIIEPPHLCFHVWVYVTALEAEPEKAHCCRGEKENKTHQWGGDMQSVFTGNERHESVNGGVFLLLGFFCIKPTQVCVPHVTHTCTKNVTAGMWREATAIGRLLCLSSNRIPFPWEGLIRQTHEYTWFHMSPLQEAPKPSIGHCQISKISQ